ncbi:biotin transporter BioY [Leptolyngbya sp. 'hensonii']|uniref:biotin transporter BioY n=1 Tax=Leptolyngbya sp. 'hensonii' TaxID=1922337 RepID=UPI00094FFA05|nr:biotin transporter BioY [Leptolyngbya sp. 'hensonii']OLP17531.1 biotin transporter BioY [Leptolyngbya sp. 'hensonii']
MVAVPIELLWAFIGLILTIIGTFLQAFITSPPWEWGHHGLQAYPLGVTYQIGAVLLVGCMGGRNAGALSQIAYLALGLSGFPVFTGGGGLNSYQDPTFGYLLGFLPGAWICGSIAFLAPPKLESLCFSCLCGLLAIHLTGISYLMLGHAFHWFNKFAPSLLDSLFMHSVYHIPGHLAVTCAVAVLAYAMRRLMFY